MGARVRTAAVWVSRFPLRARSCPRPMGRSARSGRWPCPNPTTGLWPDCQFLTLGRWRRCACRGSFSEAVQAPRQPPLRGATSHGSRSGAFLHGATCKPHWTPATWAAGTRTYRVGPAHRLPPKEALPASGAPRAGAVAKETGVRGSRLAEPSRRWTRRRVPGAGRPAQDFLAPGSLCEGDRSFRQALLSALRHVSLLE